MRHWWRTLRPAARIARRDAVRSRGRTALVAAMIGLPVLVGVGGAVLVQSAQGTPADRALAELGDVAQAWVRVASTGTVVQDGFADSMSSTDGDDGEAAPSSSTREAAIQTLAPGDRVAAVRSVAVLFSTDSRSLHDAREVQAFSPQDADLVRGHLTAGRLPAADGEVLLPQEVAESLGTEVGDVVQATSSNGGTTDLTVVGIDRSAGQATAVGTVAGDATTAGWYVVGQTPVDWQGVQTLNGLGLSVISRSVVADPPPTPPEVDFGDPSKSQAVTLVAAGVAMGIIEGVLLVGPAFAVGARRNSRALALVAAAGGERRALRHIVLMGGVVIGVGASVLGALVGLLVALVVVETVNRRTDAFVAFSVPWRVCVAFVVLGVVVSTAAAWLPARRAASADVVAALAGRRSEARPRRRIPVIGLGLALVGIAAAVFGAVNRQVVVLVVGVVSLQLGVVATSGGLVTLVGRLAPRLGVAGRIATRDAARQRGRTAPAVAAVIAAMAGIVAGAIFVQSTDAARREAYDLSAAPGTVLASYAEPSDAFGEPLSDPAAPDAAGLEAALRRTLPVAATAHVAVPDLGDMQEITAVPAPGRSCPRTPDAGPDGVRDTRCYAEGAFGTFEHLYSAGSMSAAELVDDGTTLAALGMTDAATLRAVRDGAVMVSDPDDLWPDGTVHLRLLSYTENEAEADAKNVVAPAVLGPRSGQFSRVLPPAVVRQLGLTSVDAGIVATTGRTPNRAEQGAADAALSGIGNLFVERGYQGQTSLTLLILVAAAVVVGLGSTALAMALAAAEFRPDLATLGAIGASPRMRRRVAAAQAGVVVIIGVGLGTLAGLLMGQVLVLAKRHSTGDVPLEHLVVPWPTIAAIVIGVPALAMGGAYVLTRSRLPMARRVTG